MSEWPPRLFRLGRIDPEQCEIRRPKFNLATAAGVGARLAQLCKAG